jgi:hypothetical protein
LFLQGNQYQYAIALKKKYGEGIIEELEKIKNTPVKFKGRTSSYATTGDFKGDGLYKSTDGIMIRINGDPALVRANSNRDLNHISETALDNADFEYVINNNGTLTELREKLEEIFSEIKSDLI